MPISGFTILAVAAGGVIGTLARFAMIALAHRDGLAHTHWTILWVNLIGCFALGVVVGFLQDRPQATQALIGFACVGALGSFTTFSTFALDALRLIQAGRHAEALGYVCASVAGGIAVAAAGFAGASRVLAPGA